MLRKRHDRLYESDAGEPPGEKFPKIPAPASGVAFMPLQSPGALQQPPAPAEQVGWPLVAAGRPVGRDGGGCWVTRAVGVGGSASATCCRARKSSEGETRSIFPRNQDFRVHDSQLCKWWWTKVPRSTGRERTGCHVASSRAQPVSVCPAAQAARHVGAAGRREQPSEARECFS